MDDRRCSASVSEGMIECSDCDRLFTLQEYAFHDCNGALILDKDDPRHRSEMGATSTNLTSAGPEDPGDVSNGGLWRHIRGTA